MRIEVIDYTQIMIIKNLWEELNKLHFQDSKYFKDHFKNLTFEDRCKSLELKDEVKIFVIYEGSCAIGYCLASVMDHDGEIDSLFVLDEYRNYGYGQLLVQQCLSWLETNKCKKITVSVADGHEYVFGFYEKFGFYPRLTFLQRK